MMFNKFLENHPILPEVYTICLEYVNNIISTTNPRIKSPITKSKIAWRYILR